MSNVSETKKHARTSDEGEGETTKKIDGKKGLERLAEFTRRIVRAGKISKQKAG